MFKWVVDRARLRVGDQDTTFGWVPKAGDLDLSGRDISSEQVDAGTSIDLDECRAVLESQGEFFEATDPGPTMPRALERHRELLLARIESMHGKWSVG